MNTPQIIAIALLALDLGYVLAKDGKPREPYSFWSQGLRTVIWLLVLTWGGFFG